MARLVRLHAPEAELRFKDVSGHVRSARLQDQVESQWFAGVQIGLEETTRSVLRRGWRAIDVGANVGIVTGQLAVAVGSMGRVDAFEPIPDNHRRLQALVHDNRLSNVHIWPTAVGDEPGELTLRLPAEGNSGWASVSASWNSAGTVVVPVTTLDRAIEATGVPAVHFVKIDVEGSEFAVLAGGHRTWAEQAPLLLLEFNDVLLHDAGSSSAELLTAAADYGYSPIRPLDRQWLDGSVRDVLLSHRSAVD